MKTHPCKELLLDADRQRVGRDGAPLFGPVMFLQFMFREGGVNWHWLLHNKAPVREVTSIPAIIWRPLPSTTGVSKFPVCILRKKMTKVVKLNICIHLKERESLGGIWEGKKRFGQLAVLFGTAP
jgi:hypothetical protein